LNYTHQDKTLSAAHFRQGAHAYTLHRNVMRCNVNLAPGINCACTPCSHPDVKRNRVKEMHKFVGLKHLHCFHLNKCTSQR